MMRACARAREYVYGSSARGRAWFERFWAVLLGIGVPMGYNMYLPFIVQGAGEELGWGKDAAILRATGKVECEDAWKKCVLVDGSAFDLARAPVCVCI